ncbi:DsbA family protein [Vannielia litorea]|uniref:Protein-disulfide isomerase n=1 Tax=Vannielia litorea TaxID=1217970 RepID=A0A1N6HNL2_9RHOB|nr:DsbA family protein [Vannielia litorea]SIO21438.1 Protein-disulfide isomerase [Vannielia litorea]
MNTKILYSALFVAALAVGTYFAIGGTSTPGGTGFDLAAQAQTAEEIDTSSIVEMTLGDENAPVKVIEYASFTCPHCASFHQNVFKQLKTNYIDTGKVHFTYREIYFDKPGLWAGMVARCAGPVRYFGISDALYAGQSEWLASRDLTGIHADLRKLAVKSGLDGAQVDACLADAEKAQAMYALFLKNAEADGIDSTPSFVIDGEKHSNMNYEEFTEILDAKLGE